LKLKSGCIFWPQVFEGVERRFGPLRTDIQCEVAIIGGGVSGAFAAFYLCREGIDTVLVDRRRVGHGSTAASTGLLQYEIDTPLVELIGRIGEAKAVAAYRASLDGLMAFEPLVEELGDRCGLAARPSLYLASKESDVAELIAEGEARRAMGIDVKFMSGDALKSEWGICRPGALWSAKGFEIDPFRLTLGLMNHAIARGLRVFEGTEIARFEAKGGGVELADAESRRICARKVIFAMGYETL
jgi:glycine/D-amino acid oxidase-like deaminating enzyme